MNIGIAAVGGILFGVVTAGVVLFQVALALGAPWGRYAMGGQFPGRFPPPMRVAAMIQAVLLVGLAAIVASEAGLLASDLARALPWLIWLPVAVSGIALVLNVITPSAGERMIWAPVTGLMLLASLVVALTPP